MGLVGCCLDRVAWPLRSEQSPEGNAESCRDLKEKHSRQRDPQEQSL